MQKYLKSPAAQLLSKSGALKAHLSGFSERLEQQLMAEEVTNAIEAKEAVSYTHLTLPTKRIV